MSFIVLTKLLNLYYASIICSTSDMRKLGKPIHGNSNPVVIFLCCLDKSSKSFSLYQRHVNVWLY